MKAIRLSFIQMLSFLRRDMMLFAACVAPFLIGLIFHFGIPALEQVLTRYFHSTAILAPYYEIFDIFFSMLTPTMFCYVAAMVILEENDDHIVRYLFVTPLRKTGYLWARLGLPCVIAFVLTGGLLPVFKLTDLGIVETIYLAISGALQGGIIALIIVTLSSNKLEGMAITKLSTITILGILVPYFIQQKIQYVLVFLPSFWIGKAIYERSQFHMLISILISVLWIGMLMKLFLHKTV